MGNICFIENCGKSEHCRGFCSKHYARWRKYGDPLFFKGTELGSLLSWIHDHCNYLGDDCLKWPFGKTSHNRGVVLLNGVGHSAARVMAIFALGEPPFPTHEVSHTCGNGHLGCVNPRHLAWETEAENQARKVLHGRSIRGEANTKSKLTESQVIGLRLEFSCQPQTFKDLGRKFGIGASAAHSIVTGKTWAWLK